MRGRPSLKGARHEHCRPVPDRSCSFPRPAGRGARAAARLRARSRTAGPDVPRDVPHAHLRRQGDRAAAHRQARDLRVCARPGGDRGRGGERDACRGRAVSLLSRARRPARARRAHRGEPALLGRRRARQRLRPGPPRLSQLRADRHPGLPRRRGGLRLPAARRGACGGVLPRRRRQLEGRLLRGAQLRRRLEGAPADRGEQQPVGDLGAAQRAERHRHAGAEGHRRRRRWRAGRRQRPRCSAPRCP